MYEMPEDPLFRGRINIFASSYVNMTARGKGYIVLYLALIMLDLMVLF